MDLQSPEYLDTALTFLEFAKKRNSDLTLTVSFSIFDAEGKTVEKTVDIYPFEEDNKGVAISNGITENASCNVKVSKNVMLQLLEGKAEVMRTMMAGELMVDNLENILLFLSCFDFSPETIETFKDEHGIIQREGNDGSPESLSQQNNDSLPLLGGALEDDISLKTRMARGSLWVIQGVAMFSQGVTNVVKSVKEHESYASAKVSFAESKEVIDNVELFQKASGHQVTQAFREMASQTLHRIKETADELSEKSARRGAEVVQSLQQTAYENCPPAMTEEKKNEQKQMQQEMHLVHTQDKRRRADAERAALEERLRALREKNAAAAANRRSRCQCREEPAQE